MCRNYQRSNRCAGPLDFEGEGLRRATSSCSALGCGKRHGYGREQRPRDSWSVRSSSNTSRVGKFPDEGFEQITSLSIVPEYAEARRGGRKQTDLVRLRAFEGDFHSLFHITHEKSIRQQRVSRMCLNRLPDANAGGRKKDQCFDVWRQLLTEMREVKITLVSSQKEGLNVGAKRLDRRQRRIRNCCN